MRQLLALLFATLTTAPLWATTFHVTPSASGGDDGLSWGLPMTLQEALSTATSGDQIWLQSGNYLPGSGSGDTFTVPNGVELYGGFITGSETTLGERDFANNVTVLSGDIGTPSVHTDNSISVVTVGGNATFDGVHINDGYNALYQGAGINITSSTNLTIRNCVFYNNRSREGAAVRFNAACVGIIENSVFFSNTVNHATGGDGGAFYGAFNGQVVNCMFIQNSSFRAGGAVYSSGVVDYINCLFTENSSNNNGGAEGGAITANNGSTVLKNCIVRGNTTGGSGPANVSKWAGTAMPAHYSNIEGDTAELNLVVGNIDTAEVFVDSGSWAGPDLLWLTSDDGAAIDTGSPSIDAGGTFPPYTDKDILDLPRDGSPDIGPYEFGASAGPLTIYVDASAGGSNDGSGWTNAYTDLQSALGNAMPGDSIWIATGNYFPGSSMTDTFSISENVVLIGGFSGNGLETMEHEADPGMNPTILSGDIGTPGLNTDNIDHVVTISGNFVELIGLIIEKGHAASGYGNGIRSSGAHGLLIERCVIRNNSSPNAGGAGLFVEILSGTNLPGNRVIDTVFENNETLYNGGGVYWSNSYDGFNDEFVNCIFINNRADWAGAGMRYIGNGKIINCTFINNEDTVPGGATNQAGQLAVGFDGNPIIKNLIVTGANNTFDISSDRTGGDPVVTLYDSYIGGSSIGTANSSDNTKLAFGANVVFGSPEFVDINNPAGPDGIWMTEDDGIRLAGGAQAIDLGTPEPPATDFDILGKTRDGNPDAGAYEYSPAEPIANYLFDGDALDIGPGSFDGTITGAVFTSGMNGQAISFDGTNDDVTMAGTVNNLPIGNAPRTIAFWMKPSDLSQGTVFSYGGSSQYDEFSLKQFSGGGLGFTASFYDVNSTYVAVQDVWQHFVIVFDGTNMSFYANGAHQITSDASLVNTTFGSALSIAKNVGQGYWGGAIDDFRIYDVALSAGEVHDLYQFTPGVFELVIDRHPVDFEVFGSTVIALNIMDFNGDLVTTDNSTSITITPTGSANITGVLIGNGDGSYGSPGGPETITVTGGEAEVVISSDSVGSFMLSFTNSEGFPAPLPVVVETYPVGGDPNVSLRGHWPMDEGTGNFTGDLTPYMNGLVTQGGMSPGAWNGFGQPGGSNESLQFDGVSHHLASGNNGAYKDFTEMTLAVWINPDTLSGIQAIVQNWPFYSEERSFGIHLNGADWNFSLSGNGMSEEQFDFGTSGANLVVGQWQHLAATYDGLEVELRLNGNLMGNTVYNLGIHDGAGNIQMGARLDAISGGNITLPYQGAMADVRLYDRALNAAEISQLVVPVPPSTANVILAGTPYVPPTSVTTSQANVALVEFEMDTTTEGFSGLIQQVIFEVVDGSPLTDVTTFYLYDETNYVVSSDNAMPISGNIAFSNLNIGLSGGANTVFSLRADMAPSFTGDNLLIDIVPSDITVDTGMVIGSTQSTGSISLNSGGGPGLVPDTSFTIPSFITTSQNNELVLIWDMDTENTGYNGNIQEIVFDVYSADPSVELTGALVYDLSMGNLVSNSPTIGSDNIVFSGLNFELSSAANTILELKVSTASSFSSGNIEFQIDPADILLDNGTVMGSIYSTGNIVLLTPFGGATFTGGPNAEPTGFTKGDNDVFLIDFDVDVANGSPEEIITSIRLNFDQGFGGSEYSNLVVKDAGANVLAELPFSSTFAGNSNLWIPFSGPSTFSIFSDVLPGASSGNLAYTLQGPNVELAGGGANIFVQPTVGIANLAPLNDPVSSANQLELLEHTPFIPLTSLERGAMDNVVLMFELQGGDNIEVIDGFTFDIYGDVSDFTAFEVIDVTSTPVLLYGGNVSTGNTSMGNIEFTGTPFELMAFGNNVLELKISVAESTIGDNIEVVLEPQGLAVVGGNVVGGNLQSSGMMSFFGSMGGAGPLAFTNLDPFNGEGNFPVDANLMISFEEPIDLLGGNIELYQEGGFIDAFDKNSSFVTVLTNEIVIDPAGDLAAAANFHILIDPGMVAGNTSGNIFGGFSTNAEWAFTTGNGGGPPNIYLVPTTFSPNASVANSVANAIVIEFELDTTAEGASGLLDSIEFDTATDLSDFTNFRLWDNLLANEIAASSTTSNGNILFSGLSYGLSGGANTVIQLQATTAASFTGTSLELSLRPENVIVDGGSTAVFGSPVVNPSITTGTGGSVDLNDPGFSISSIIRGDEGQAVLQFRIDNASANDEIVESLNFSFLQGNPSDDLVKAVLFDPNLATVVTVDLTAEGGNLNASSIVVDKPLPVLAGTDIELQLKLDVKLAAPSDAFEIELPSSAVILAGGNTLAGGVVNSGVVLLERGFEQSPIGAGLGTVHLLSFGDVISSGRNDLKQLGHSSDSNSFEPETYGGIIKGFDVGASHVIAFDDAGDVITWGDNSFGQSKGDGSVLSDTSIGTVVQVAAGAYSSYALNSDGELWVKGRNNVGQLGLGDTTDRTIWTKVLSLPPGTITKISAGVEHLMILSDNGNMYGFGSNGFGQLAQASGDVFSTYVGVEEGGAWVDIDAGGFHSLAVTNINTLWAGGKNSEGQLGLGFTSPSVNPPQQVSLSGTPVSISAGYRHSVFLMDNGSFSAHQAGVIGDIDSPSPVLIDNSFDVKEVDAGPFTTLLLREGNLLEALGRLPDGSTTDEFELWLNPTP